MSQVFSDGSAVGVVNEMNAQISLEFQLKLGTKSNYKWIGSIFKLGQFLHIRDSILIIWVDNGGECSHWYKMMYCRLVTILGSVDQVINGFLEDNLIDLSSIGFTQVIELHNATCICNM